MDRVRVGFWAIRIIVLLYWHWSLFWFHRKISGNCIFFTVYLKRCYQKSIQLDYSRTRMFSSVLQDSLNGMKYSKWDEGRKQLKNLFNIFLVSDEMRSILICCLSLPPSFSVFSFTSARPIGDPFCHQIFMSHIIVIISIIAFVAAVVCRVSVYNRDNVSRIYNKYNIQFIFVCSILVLYAQQTNKVETVYLGSGIILIMPIKQKLNARPESSTSHLLLWATHTAYRYIISAQNARIVSA